MVKYLLYRKLELALKDKKPLSPIHDLFAKYFPPSSLKPQEYSHQELLGHLKDNTSDVNYLIPSSNYQETIDFISYYLTENYVKDLARNPTLFVCGGHVGKWERRLKETCYQLNVAVLKGT